MNEALLRSHYSKRGLDELAANQAVFAVKTFENMLADKNLTFENTTISAVKDYIQSLIKTQTNSIACLMALARYFFLIDRKDIYIYFTSLLGGIGVIESITGRITQYEGQDIVDEIFKTLEKPPLGSEPSDFPGFTSRLMTQLENHIPLENVNKILAGNNHSIPKDPFLKEKEVYKGFSSLDDYLVDLHKRKVHELQEHCNQDKLWYEQRITQRVVDFVASNQEILSAVRQDDVLYVTKIPYNPDQYLTEDNPKLKCYYACHCPFAREAILKGEPLISPNWCYCSAGFEKFPFDIILDRELKVEVLQSALKGDAVCRFAIHL